MRYLLAFICICISSVSFAQTVSLDSAEVKNTTIEFNGGKYNGYLLELNAPPDIVENAIRERFKAQGVKPKETKDFLVFRNVVIPQIDEKKPVDAFVKVERKSKKEKDQSSVFFIAAEPGQIPDDKVKSGSGGGAGLAFAATGGLFLSGMIPDVKKGVLGKDIANQQTYLKKAEKQLADLKDDEEDMEKKLQKLQSDLEFNKKAQERQVAEIEKARTTLGELNTKNGKN